MTEYFYYAYIQKAVDKKKEEGMTVEMLIEAHSRVPRGATVKVFASYGAMLSALKVKPMNFDNGGVPTEVLISTEVDGGTSQ